MGNGTSLVVISTVWLHSTEALRADQPRRPRRSIAAIDFTNPSLS